MSIFITPPTRLNRGPRSGFARPGGGGCSQPTISNEEE